METIILIILLLFLLYVPITLYKVNKKIDKLSYKVEREVLIYASHSEHN